MDGDEYMTGGWRGESARHALAAKGIPTAALRASRGYHTARPLEDRIADEDRVEPYVEDIALWAKDPDKYDLHGVDDPVPEGYKIERSLALDKGRIGLTMTEKDDEKWIAILDMHYVNVVDGTDYYAFSIHVDKDHRNMGLSRYLMRHMVNLADDMQIGIAANISPIALDADILASYYASFGFTRSTTVYPDGGGFDIVRPPQSKEGSLIE